MMAAEFAKLVKNATRRADRKWWDARCPAHDDRRASLSFCDGDMSLVVECHAGCSREHIAAGVGRTIADFRHRSGHRREVAVYPYRDERGELLFEEVRFEPKDFRLRRPDGQGGWIWDLKGVRRLPYRLDELAEQRRVFFVEGPKDADRLWSLGIPATTTPTGAKGWLDEYAQQIRDAGAEEVIACRDNDEAGLQYVRKAAAAFTRLGVTVRMLELPALPPKGDVSDWLDAGHTVSELAALAENAPVFISDDAPALSSGPRAVLTPEDGAFTWSDGASITFSRVTEDSRGGVSAEIAVNWNDRGLLDYLHLNLLAPRSRDQIVAKLDRLVSGPAWQAYLDDACRQMIARRREGEPVEQLEARPRLAEQYLVRPVLAAGQTTVTFGPGGSGKSLYALMLEIAAATGCALPTDLRAVRTCPVLVLDWESSRAAHEARLYELCRALGIAPPTTIYYKRMTAPLSDAIRQIRTDVSRLGIGLVRVDSLALASGREPEGADAATRTLNDLRTLGDQVTRHVVAHVAKSGLDSQAPGHVYGSVFNENIPRDVYEIRAATDAPEDEIIQAIYHRKTNESRRHSPVTLRFILSPEDLPPEDKTIRVEACGLREAPDLNARAPLSQQLKAALSNGAKTISSLAIELGAKEDTIDKTLRRHPRIFVQLPGEKPPYRWGIVQTSVSASQ